MDNTKISSIRICFVAAKPANRHTGMQVSANDFQALLTSATDCVSRRTFVAFKLGIFEVDLRSIHIDV